MNLSIFNSFFNKKSNTLHVPDSILVKKLKSLCTHSNLLVYNDIKIYHHKDRYNIPLIMLDPLRGLYIFEIKAWSYDDLKSAHIQKAKNQNASAKTLSFDNTHNIIRKKFNELTHHDGVPIFNYLIMENLSADEYEHLNDSFKELLPFNKLIFNDYHDSDIFKILQEVSPEDHTLPPINNILGTLFVQYAIVESESLIHFATQEQMDFINMPLEEISVLNGVPSSGKSSLILLKSIVSLLEDSSTTIIILKPTVLACDIFKKRLLEIVEHGIIEVDLSSIEIITPLELLNRHLKKINMPEVDTISNIDSQLMKKKFKSADVIMCDDSNLLPYSFIEYLKRIQKKSKLLFVNDKRSSHENSLTKEFKKEEQEIIFFETNPYAKVLQLTHNFFKHDKQESVMVISNSKTQEKLLDDIGSYVFQVPQQLDSSKHLINQEFSPLILATYTDINTLSAKHIIMLDLCSESPDKIEYALNIDTLSTYVLYQEDCQEIIDLKDKYESSQERARVEGTTDS
jgi:hypothetical protein